MLLPWPTVYPPHCTQCDTAACQEIDGQMLMESEVDGWSANLNVAYEWTWRWEPSAPTVWISWTVKGEIHPSLIKEVFRCPVHQTHKRRWSTRTCSSASRVWLWGEWGLHLVPIRKALCFQTCLLTVDGEVLNELKLDKNRLYRHGNTNHSRYSWQPPDFLEQWEQKYAPLSLPH